MLFVVVVVLGNRSRFSLFQKPVSAHLLVSCYNFAELITTAALNKLMGFYISLINYQ